MKFPEKCKPPVILSVSSRFSEENYAQICQDKKVCHQKVSSHFDFKIFLSNTSKAKLFTLIVPAFVFVCRKLSFVSWILIRYFRREKFHDLCSEQIKTWVFSFSDFSLRKRPQSCLKLYSDLPRYQVFFKYFTSNICLGQYQTTL